MTDHIVTDFVYSSSRDSDLTFALEVLLCVVQGPGCFWEGHSSVTRAGGPQIRGSAV